MSSLTSQAIIDPLQAHPMHESLLQLSWYTHPEARLSLQAAHQHYLRACRIPGKVSKQVRLACSTNACI